MRRKRKTKDANSGNILEHTIGELLERDYDLLRYKLLARKRTLETELRLLEEIIRASSSDLSRQLTSEYMEELKNRCDMLKKEVELLKTAGAKLTLLKTIEKIGSELEEKSKQSDSDKELREGYNKLWEAIKRLRLKDLLNYSGDPEDKLALYNYLISLVKGVELPPPPLETRPIPAVSVKLPEKPAEMFSEKPAQLVVSEREFVSMSVDDWRSLLKQCLAENRQLELPKNYLAPSMKRPLRTLLTALLEQPPERLKFIIPKEYKYLMILHGILFTIFVEKKPYVVTPGSSDKEYIEGEGGLLSVFEASHVGDEAGENVRRRYYVISIGGREYKIVREIQLEGGRARQIKYSIVQ